MNLIATIAAFAVIIGFVLYFFRKRKDDIDVEENEYSIDFAVKLVTEKFRDRLRGSAFGKASAADSKKESAQIKELRSASNKATHGSLSDKLHSKAVIKEILTESYELDGTNINRFIPFDKPNLLTPIEMFNIMLYWYRYPLDHGADAFDKWVDRHNLFVPKPVVYSMVEMELTEEQAVEMEKKGYIIDHSGKTPVIRTDNGFIIYPKEVVQAYHTELKAGMKLTLSDKVNVFTQAVYSRYLGLGVIDELLDMNVNGIRGGTGGIPESAAEIVGGMFEEGHAPKRDYESIRLFYKGNQLHLDFLKFPNGRELRRVVNMIYQYGRVGQLNRESGFKYSERADHSRVVVVTPDLADSPAFFVRKFDPRLKDLREWFEKTDKNWEMVYDWIRFCAAAGITICFTGAQGAGKTTIMRGAMKFFPFNWNIRVIEGTFFELWVRINFWWKDIITLKETPTVSSTKANEIVRRTDGTMTIFGEVISDEGVREATKASRIGSYGTWFSYHTMTVHDMITEGATSLTITGAATDKKDAVREMAKSVNGNMHLKNDLGHRYMDRFSQVWPTESKPYTPVLDGSLDESVASIAHNIREQAVKTTEITGYETDDLFVYDPEFGGYVVKSEPSRAILEKFSMYMDPSMKVQFKEYAKRVFGMDWEG